ncbi:hypothetical protein B0H19DRAFT_1250092 [Mycena capillaripes]|nr:hypothetical protein B0H19DRAFT_1250092 [Mycena capillaripes]
MACTTLEGCRELPDILWSCVYTLGACTWSALHLNIPPQKSRLWHVILRKFFVFFITLLAPELLVGVAIRECLMARIFARRYGLSSVPAWFLFMGGFATHSGNPVITQRQLERPEVIDAIKDICHQDIVDKIKGDTAFKGFTILQVSWTTHADVDIGVFAARSWFDRLLSGVGFLAEPSPTSILSAWSPQDSPPVTGQDTTSELIYIVNCVVAVTFGAIHCAAWSLEFILASEMWIWRVSSILATSIPAFVFSGTYFLSVLETKERRWAKAVAYLIRVWRPILVLSRGALVVLPLAAMRSLPPGALMDLGWILWVPFP